MPFFVLFIILELDDRTKGLLFGLASIIMVGFQPIVVSSWKIAIDLTSYSEDLQIPALYLFSAMTCLFEALLFFPIMLIDRKMILVNQSKENIENVKENFLLNGWKKRKLILVYVGLTFGIGQLLFTIGYYHAGPINGALAQKSTVIFTLIFGYLIMKEKITKTQILFSLILLIGLIFTVTQGSFNVLEFNIGVLLLLILAAMWMLAHAITKRYILDEKNSTSTQIVFMRNAISSIILLASFLIFFSPTIEFLFGNPINILYYFLMGLTYSSGLFFWYKTLSLLDASKATILVSPTPIVTAIFSVIMLGETFTIYHLIGSIIVIMSIVIIVKQPTGDKIKEIEKGII
ncbi:MAG: DMT family transporter [Candidatus Lokiarchaeota archaeon]|nr:DMT family transporter [Candidatus Lokiarchaeota archaeon]